MCQCPFNINIVITASYKHQIKQHVNASTNYIFSAVVRRRFGDNTFQRVQTGPDRAPTFVLHFSFQFHTMLCYVYANKFIDWSIYIYAIITISICWLRLDLNWRVTITQAFFYPDSQTPYIGLSVWGIAGIGEYSGWWASESCAPAASGVTVQGYRWSGGLGCPETERFSLNKRVHTYIHRSIATDPRCNVLGTGAWGYSGNTACGC